MSAVVLFIPAKGLLVRRPIGRPLGVILVGGRDTFGESVIRDGGRRRCICAIERVACHGFNGRGWDENIDALCSQNKHSVWEERDIELIDNLRLAQIISGEALAVVVVTTLAPG